MTARALVEILAIFLMFGLSVLVFQLWWLAFVGGGQVTISIDTFGEMWFEFVLWFVIAPIILVGFLHYVVDRFTAATDPDQPDLADAPSPEE